MTREEAIIYLKQADVTVGRDIKTKTAEALEMAIKTLEQETVSKESYDHEYFLRKELEITIARLEQILDKVRVEIKQYQSDYDVHGTEYDRTAWKAFNRCLQIIDKYGG